MKGTAGFNMIGSVYSANTTASPQDFFGECIVVGHRDLQTSFCEDFSKKEDIRITHQAWRN
jgi:hypothetical protein